MKARRFVAAALLVVAARAAEPARAVSDGRALYAEAQFAKAVAAFQPVCNLDHDAEACYLTGISYERLGDTKTPFGCREYRNAHDYLAKAAKAAPDRPEYRDAFFEFLLNSADCSRKALGEAAEVLSAVPEADPEYAFMRSRLSQQTRWSASLATGIGKVFLLLPRATCRVSEAATNPLPRQPR